MDIDITPDHPAEIDIPGAVARHSARMVDLLRERDDLRRAHRPQQQVLTDARTLVDQAAKRYRDRIADKLLAFGAPNGPALRLFSGPDADALCWLLGTDIKKALGTIHPTWPSVPQDRERRLERIEREIESLEGELTRIRNLFDEAQRP